MLHFSNPQKNLLHLLADGKFHSGTQLASSLNISRAAIWKQLEVLTADYGLDIIALRGKGYKLHRPLELLVAEQIKAALTPVAADLLTGLEIYQRIDSTNRYLSDRAQQTLSGLVCLAETQTAGKGRRGRQWVSPFGNNIYLSLLWHYPNDLSSIAGLSLAVGVAVIRALHSLGLTEIGLKWPNDIYWHKQKLGGILIEVSGETGGSCHAVIGLGLNLYLPSKETATITQPWTDLSQIKGSISYSRNTLTSLLLNHLLPVVARFDSNGLKAYLPEWRAADVLLNQAVNLYIGDKKMSGLVAGIDDNGLLLFKNNAGEIKTFASGEVSFHDTGINKAAVLP